MDNQTDLPKEPYNTREKAQANSVMIKLSDGTTFRCLECGANVFQKLSGNRYSCNGCLTVYRGEK